MDRPEDSSDTIAEALRESEEKYRKLFEASLDAIFLETVDGLVLDCNDVACRMYGYERDELVGMSVRDLVPPEFRERLPRIIEEHQKSEGIFIEAENVRKDGSAFPAEVNTRRVELGGQTRVIVYVRDISRRVRMEAEREMLRAQLMHAQKFEAMGMMASGVAHEINNPMQVIINYAQLLSSRLERGTQEKEFCDEITRESFRVAAIVRELLSMARPQRKEPRPESLDNILRNTMMLFRSAQIQEDFTIEASLEDDLPMVVCHPREIQQVLMNLLTNARHALNRRYEDRHPDKRIVLRVALVDDGNRPMVRTTVEDRGTGIDPMVVERIFEPFFTTKPDGEGTGLGLSVSRQIARDHGGDLSVQSEPGQYTRFYLDLPAAS